ncbi:MAG TPA: methyltransferase domain-containing protein [Pseudonocardiaceae bacterium]|nr:methyltransferase domain-containing protein [Pseudonocardiaceae bacterium]
MTSVGADVLPLTGERTVPGIPQENYWFRRHEAAYRYLVPYCAQALVADAGCGEGYGAALLAAQARRVVALDYDRRTTGHVARRYPELATVRTNLAALPLASGSLDVVACLQVIEHLWDQPQFLAECARVLRPGGRLLVSTPNRLTFSPGRDAPLNPFHTRELTARELSALLRDAGFTVGSMAGLHHGRALRALDTAHGGSLIDAQLAVADGSWPPRLLADVAEVRATDFVIRCSDGGDVDGALDLVAAATTR